MTPEEFDERFAGITDATLYWERLPDGLVVRSAGIPHRGSVKNLGDKFSAHRIDDKKLSGTIFGTLDEALAHVRAAGKLAGT